MIHIYEISSESRVIRTRLAKFYRVNDRLTPVIKELNLCSEYFFYFQFTRAVDNENNVEI